MLNVVIGNPQPPHAARINAGACESFAGDYEVEPGAACD